MRKHNPNNERIKRKYLTFLTQAKGQNEATIDVVAKALARFESYTKCKDFKEFHFQQAIGFKKHLAAQKHYKTGLPLSMATLNATARHLKAFIQWLAQETGYRSRVNYSDAEYFNIAEKDARIAKAKRNKPAATVEQIKHVLQLMPNDSPIEKRDRALIAFTLLTGARDSAIASFKLKHIDFNTDTLYQDAREVNTKFSKTITTCFFPVGEEVRAIVLDWVEYLKRECLFGHDAPLFPKTKMSQDSNHNFKVSGLSDEHWRNTTPIRRIFNAAFSLADLPSFKPHSFRNTLVFLGEQRCQSAEQFKAWSQNLGHEGVLTTFYSYGEVQESRQADIFKQFNGPQTIVDHPDVVILARALAKEMSRQNG